MGVEEGEETQTKGIGNRFNRITTENFPNLEKEKVILMQGAYRTQNHRSKKEHQYTEQRKNSESCKREKIGQI
jgi:hypothetical protein